jgi:hypothetical protein
VEGRIEGVRFRRNFKSKEEAVAGKAILDLKYLQLFSNIRSATMFLTDNIPWDSFDVGRVDLQCGPHSILFRHGQPGRHFPAWRLLWDARKTTPGARGR